MILVIILSSFCVVSTLGAAYMYWKYSKQQQKAKTLQKSHQNALFKGAGFDGTTVALMTIDRDFKVTHVNQATVDLLRRHQETFREKWPTFDADNILGKCIDVFHKNPAHQRQLLADASRLPFKTDISVGDLKIALNVMGVFTKNNEYVGNILEWDDVTEQRSNKGKLDSLERTQGLIEFNLDGTIIDANENFLNVMGYRLDEIVGRHHRIFVNEAISRGADYAHLWEDLAKGKSVSNLFERVAKNGDVRYIRGSYNSILDGNGAPFRVVKFATDETEYQLQRMRDEEESAQRAQSQEIVVTKLADGLQRLSQGDFSQVIDVEFAEDYEKLRHDFNSAVEQLKLADAQAKETAQAQETVVSNLATGLNKLAEGDLTKRIDAEFTADYEQLRLDFNAAISSLEKIVQTFIATADGIHNSSGQVSASVESLSQRTESQAATLEETAAALDQITATVRQTADGANEANSVVEKTRNEAEVSGDVVREAVDAMGEIENSSGQISQIIGVIDDIAFQTNLLALNAGVEAARAGDAGRGFAVVAQEVRALAQRSSEAAKEIKTLISSSTSQVERGVDLVGKTGKALTDIVEGVANISSLVSEITGSTKEQSVSLSEVNGAVNKMDQGTQQNAAMVEETTAACHTLNSDADELLRQIAHFKVSGERRRKQDRRASVQSPAQIEHANEDDSVHSLQNKVRAIATNVDGNTALKEPVNENDWQEF